MSSRGGCGGLARDGLKTSTEEDFPRFAPRSGAFRSSTRKGPLPPPPSTKSGRTRGPRSQYMGAVCRSSFGQVPPREYETTYAKDNGGSTSARQPKIVCVEEDKQSFNEGLHDRKKPLDRKRSPWGIHRPPGRAGRRGRSK